MHKKIRCTSSASEWRPRIHPEGAILSSGFTEKFFGVYCRIWAITDAPELFQFPLYFRYSVPLTYYLIMRTQMHAYSSMRIIHCLLIKSPKIGSFIIGSYSSARASIYVPFRPRKRRISLPSKMHFLAQCLKIIKSLAKIQITKICLFSATERQLGLFARFARNVVKMRHFKWFSPTMFSLKVT